MPHQNAGAGDSILVMIALVSMVVFILVLFASFVIVHPKGRTESQAGPKKEHRSSLAAAVRARLFSPDRPKRELTARQSAILASLKTRCGAETPSSDLRFSRRIILNSLARFITIENTNG